jgi:thiamine-monophosphate kinase
MIDISDGLLRDLGHIMRASGIGVLLKLEAIPISPAARRRLAGRRRALGRALTDGEDYELLFTVPEKKKDAFRRAWRRKFRLACVQIGRTTRRAGLLEGLDAAGKRIQLQENGFEHFVGQRAPENPGQTTRSGKRGLRG